jgi:hypothetical protein
MKQKKTSSILLALLGATLLIGCGGGGGGSSSSSTVPASGPVSLLSWAAPATFADNVSMDPYNDLDYYELYVREDANFTESDLPVAQLSAVADVASSDGSTMVRALVTEFALELLPNVPAGNRLYVSIKAVGIDRQRSAFMAPVTWDRL